jgi:hypothetical protein
MDQDKMCNLYRGSSIDASYHVSVHLAKQFQRRRFKCEKLTDRRTLTHDKSSHGLWPGELKISWFINIIMQLHQIVFCIPFSRYECHYGFYRPIMALKAIIGRQSIFEQNNVLAV